MKAVLTRVTRAAVRVDGEIVGEIDGGDTGGILALVGVPGRASAEFPIGAVQRWELDIRGCFRYGPSAFADAIALAGSARVDLAALVTSTYPLAESAAALEAALTDPTQLKIVIDTTSQGPQ